MPQVVYLFRDKVRPGQSGEVSRGQIQLLYVCVFGPNYQNVYLKKKNLFRRQTSVSAIPFVTDESYFAI